MRKIIVSDDIYIETLEIVPSESNTFSGFRPSHYRYMKSVANSILTSKMRQIANVTKVTKSGNEVKKKQREHRTNFTKKK